MGCEDSVVEPSPAPEPDVMAPAPVTDLDASVILDCAAMLTWTATGDDGRDGTAALYDLRYAKDPFKLLTAGGWEASSIAPQLPTPSPTGTSERYLLSSLEGWIAEPNVGSTRYSFAIRVTDDAGFDSGLSNIAEMTTTSPGAWGTPGTGIAIEQTMSGAVFYVAAGERLLKLDADGNSISSFGNIHRASGVAVNNGSVFVTDSFDNTVKKFTTEGRFLLQWGGFGTQEGALIRPAGIAVLGDLVYVADARNHRVQVFDRQGHFRSTWGTLGTQAGQFNQPSSIAVARDGSVYVGDTIDGRVQKFTEDGVFVLEWKAHAWAFAFGRRHPDWIYIVTPGGIGIYGSSGARLVWRPLRLGSLPGIVVDVDDAVYVVGMESSFRFRGASN